MFTVLFTSRIRIRKQKELDADLDPEIITVLCIWIRKTDNKCIKPEGWSIAAANNCLAGLLSWHLWRTRFPDSHLYLIISYYMYKLKLLLILTAPAPATATNQNIINRVWNVEIFTTWKQCCGSESGFVLDPFSGASWIWVRIPITDPHMQL